MDRAWKASLAVLLLLVCAWNDEVVRMILPLRMGDVDGAWEISLLLPLQFVGFDSQRDGAWLRLVMFHQMELSVWVIFALDWRGVLLRRLVPSNRGLNGALRTRFVGAKWRSGLFCRLGISLVLGKPRFDYRIAWRTAGIQMKVMLLQNWLRARS